MWLIALDMIKSVAKPESSSLAMISELLSAGFQSRHEATINDLIVVWNQIFGKAEALEYPEALHHALRRIRSKVQIDLPGFVDDGETEVVESQTISKLSSMITLLTRDQIMSSPFKYVESENEGTDREVEQTSHKAAQSVSEGGAEQLLNYHPGDTSRPPSTRVLHQGCRSTPRSRLRHNDSQIQFAAVESSPLMASILESQHLTGHQRDVREQQNEGAAAMFPDIRSSPRRSRSAERPPELVLHRKQAFSQPFDADAEPSPTFPPNDSTLIDFLGSSPTPRSSRKPSLEREVNGDPASSPPDSPPSIPMPRQLAHCKASTASAHFVERTNSSNLARNAPQVALNRPGAVTVLPDTQNVRSASAYNTAGELEQRILEMDGHVMSDPEVLADAPAHPLEDKKDKQIEYKEKVTNLVPEFENPANAAVGQPSIPYAAVEDEEGAAEVINSGSEEVAGADDSFAQAPFTPSQDEQAREQLLRDLEEASSQAERPTLKRRGCSSSPSRAGKKLKGDRTTCTKRSVTTGLPAALRGCEVVIEKRKPDESIDDCFVVDDRPAAGQGRSASPAIKQERSPSPAAKPNPSLVRTPASKKGYARRRTRSMTNRESLRSSVVVIEDPSTPSARRNTSGTDLGRHEMTTIERHPTKRRRLEQQQDTGRPIEKRCSLAEDAEQPANKDGKGAPPTRTPPAEGQMPSSNNADDADDDMTSSQVESIKSLVLRPHDARPDALGASGQGLSTSSSDGDTVPNTPQDGTQQVSNAGTSQQAARSPGQRLLDRFKHLLQDLGQVALWPEEEREMVEVAVKLIQNVHEAGRKNGRHI